jgi:molecular chaperone DnaJ
LSRLVKYEAAQTCHVCEGRGTSGAVDPECPACGGTGRRSHVSDEGHARFLRVEACPICGGEVCSACEGTGREPGQRSLRVRFPAGIENGTLLRVEGEGDVGERGGAPGDLLLDVTVIAEAQDSRLVRYAALALCLAAIALLVAYVLFQ